MKVIVINGSPRKNGTTSILLNEAIKGAVSQGAETELINLYDFNYKGCKGCLACKNKDGKSYGMCAIKDELTPILKKVIDADAVIIGSPIYFSSLTGEARSFMERLIWPRMGFEGSGSPKKIIPTGYIYTMNVENITDDVLGYSYKDHFKSIELQTQWGMGAAESLSVTRIYNYPLETEYSKYFSTLINPNGTVEDTEKRKEEFITDCDKAFELGIKLAKQSTISN
ncbi:NADPH-dependent FMN reductase [Clostridium sp. DL-VIII]|uniref:flavodoxin family protein n=1 Tax=Clostridium sp. DL-VIII TaxID=641107 RepID=UPI00023B02B7|nr:flavodoxin family protein [Clostridium sp. DL-VIII]EHJ01219.1 NADPH-dependent FMN reductase [Clostridium sp. DL-VIII]